MKLEYSWSLKNSSADNHALAHELQGTFLDSNHNTYISVLLEIYLLNYMLMAFFVSNIVLFYLEDNMK
jgi:hypothetical protein